MLTYNKVSLNPNDVLLIQGNRFYNKHDTRLVVARKIIPFDDIEFVTLQMSMNQSDYYLNSRANSIPIVEEWDVLDNLGQL